MTTSEILRVVSYICYGLAAVFGFVALVVFIRRDILGTIGELIGKKAKKEIDLLEKKGRSTETRPQTQSPVAKPVQATGELEVREVESQTGEFTSSGPLNGKNKRTGRLSRNGKNDRTGTLKATENHGSGPLTLAQAEEEATALLTEETETEEATALLKEAEEEATALLTEETETEEEATALLDEAEEEATALLDEEAEEATSLLDETEEEATAILEEGASFTAGNR